MATGLVIELFGPMRVLVNGVPMGRVRSRKAYWLLALIVLRQGRATSREWLATSLWPDVELSMAFANLRPVMSELRRALGSQGWRLASEDRLSVGFNLDGVEADVTAFDVAIRDEKFDLAVELYRGNLLEGCSEEWAHQERRVREQDCLTALQSLACKAEKSGDHAKAISAYRKAIGLDGFRDAPRRGLMRALSASGDINGALQVYREYAHLLSREMGTAPEAATAALYEQLRLELRRLGRVQSADRATPSCEIPNNLPGQVTELIGREDEQIDIAAVLRRHRLVTLSGPGGIGKTRLAMAVAAELLREYPDGVWFVALDALADGAMIAPAVAATVGVAQDPTVNPVAGLVERLRGRRVLIVLDNCEHLLIAAGQLAVEMLAGCPNLRLLATSREALGVVGELAWPVPTLAYPDAGSLPAGRATRLRVVSSYESVRLFVSCAQLAQSSFELDDESVAPVVDICAQVEGVPLAIELAAARLRSMSVQTISDRLRDHHLELLGRKGPGSNGRQQSLRATLDWSYLLLGEKERSVFLSLAAFSGGWTLEAAEFVAAAGDVAQNDVADVLGCLVDKSLVIFDCESNRYHLLETVRQYGSEKSGVLGVRQSRMRHREWVELWAREHEISVYGEDRPDWAALLRLEMPNVRAALASCEEDPAAGLAIAGSLWRLFNPAGYLEEGFRLTATVVQRRGAEAQTVQRAKALVGAADLAFDRPTRELGRQFAEEGLSIFRARGDTEWIATTLCVLALNAVELGTNDVARGYFEESIAAARAGSNKTQLARILYDFACILAFTGELETRRLAIEECLALMRELDATLAFAWPLRSLALIEMECGRWDSCRALCDEALRIVEGSQDLVSLGLSLELSGIMAFECGDFPRAEELFAKASQLYRDMEDWLGTSKIMGHLSILRREQNRLAEASQLANEVLARCRQPSELIASFRAVDTLSAIRLAENAEFEARSICREYIRSFLEIGYKNGVLILLERLVYCAVYRGDTLAAAHLLGRAESMRKQLNISRSPRRDRQLQPIIEEIRNSLQPDTFKCAYDAGSKMEIEEVIAEEQLVSV